VRDKARQFLRRGLDKYESRTEQKDERYWSRLNRGMEALDDHDALKRFFYILIGLECIYWFLVLVFPGQVIDLVRFLSQWSNKVLAIMLGTVFGTGLYIAYVLFRFKFPDLENNVPGDGPINAAYSQQAGIERKFRVWVGSVVAGIANLFLLVAVAIVRVYGL
jgi:hypothetical protein